MACRERHRAGRDNRVRHGRQLAETARIQPWSKEPTASVLLDCAHADGSPVKVAPRAVLQRVVGLYVALKEKEYRDYQQRIPEWELSELMQSV